MSSEPLPETESSSGSLVAGESLTGEETPSVERRFEKPNVFFHLAAMLTGFFVITIFASIAVLFGDNRAPAAQFFDRHATAILVGEMLCILVIGTLAMTVDRRRPTPQEKSVDDIPRTSPEAASQQ